MEQILPEPTLLEKWAVTNTLYEEPLFLRAYSHSETQTVCTCSCGSTDTSYTHFSYTHFSPPAQFKVQVREINSRPLVVPRHALEAETCQVYEDLCFTITARVTSFPTAASCSHQICF